MYLCQELSVIGPPGSFDGVTEIEHRHLRSALEFAVLTASEGQKQRPPMPFPKVLKSLFKEARIPTGALGRVRRAIEADEEFRRAVGAGAVPELVDDVGRLWLQRPDGWEEQIAERIDGAILEEESADLRRDLKRSEKRRRAAEQAATRSRIEVVDRVSEIELLRSELDAERAESATAASEIDDLRRELIEARNDARHARDRAAAATARAEAAVASAPSAGEEAEPSTEGEVLSGGEAALDHEEVATEPSASIDHDELAAALGLADDLAAQLSRLMESRGTDSTSHDSTSMIGGATDRTGRQRRADRSPGRRRPIALPGGTISTSAAAAEALVRADATILVDGYNVAMLAWPDRRLDEQRDALLGRCENLARRCSAEIVVVFDGASVVGAHADRRRTVRVEYSPSDVTADDVIRSHVRSLPIERGVVVVTNDREIVDDVRRLGANVVPSNAFIAIF